MHNKSGFTLIELMIVVVVISIITMIAYPSYQTHMERTRRMGCASELMNLATAMEQYFTLNNRYTGAASGGGNTGSPAATVFPSECPVDGSAKYYDLTIQTAATLSYTLRATPKGIQSGNGYLELTSTGVRGWDRDNNGSSAEASWEDR